MYKGDYGLDITSKKDEGTTVRIVLPKHKEAQANALLSLTIEDICKNGYDH